MPLTRLVLNVDVALGQQIEAAATTTGQQPAELVLACVRQHLSGITAYGHVTDELGGIKDSIMQLAALVGEALAEPSPEALTEICRYHQGQGGASP